MQMRGAQSEALQSDGKRSFLDKMTEHVHTHFPDQCTALGERGVSQAIHLGISRARQYEIVTERDVCKYITLMFAFGHRFDEDPNLPWASSILSNKVYPDGTTRMEALYAKAKRKTRQASLQPQS